MAYKLMKKLIANYKVDKGSYEKDELLEIMDVYLAAKRLKPEQYEELFAELNEA